MLKMVGMSARNLCYTEWKLRQIEFCVCRERRRSGSVPESTAESM